ncbi:MAG: beta-lactamase family protein, partial [Verrucomicrobia bacterium]|nr:beta-lactamase family protein [Verrucomicrobiota bacterium]
MRIQQAFVSNPFEPLVARCRGSVWLLLHGLSLLAASTSSHAATAKANGFDSARLAEMSAAIEDAISRKDIPGGVLHVERQGLIHSKVLGKRAIKPSAEPLAANTIFDAASLTKVVACAPAIMILVERGQVSLQDPVHKHLPAFRGEGRDAITVRSLLNHTSGLRPGIPRQPAWSGYETGIKLAMAEKPEWPVGTRFRYSDINFILLGEIVARASGVSLDRFVDREIYEPLGMKDTGYRPPASLRKRIAPTEPVDGRMLRGVVHDPTARLMGGVAGHAGL